MQGIISAVNDVKYEPDEREMKMARRREYAAGRIYSNGGDAELMRFLLRLRMDELIAKPRDAACFDLRELLDGIFGAALIITSCMGKSMIPENICTEKIKTDESVFAGLLFFLIRKFTISKTPCRIRAAVRKKRLVIIIRGELSEGINYEKRLAERLEGRLYLLRHSRLTAAVLELPTTSEKSEKRAKNAGDYLGDRYSDAYMILSGLWNGISV